MGSILPTAMPSSPPSPPPPAPSGSQTLDSTTADPPPSSSTPLPSKIPDANPNDPPPLPSTGSKAEDQPSSTAGEGEGSGGGEGAGGGEGEEEEEEECGFCLFMKGGGCKDSFVAWEECVEETNKSGDDPVDKCFEVTSLLKKCMDAHAEYYAPIIQAEQAMSDAVEAPEAPDSKEPDSKHAMSDVVEAPDAPISKEPDSKQAMPIAPNLEEPELKQAMPDAVKVPDASDSEEPESKQAMSDAVEAAAEEEKEEECGFCLFMKGGDCKDSFVAWEECIKEADKCGEDEYDKCSEVTSLLRKCIDAHPVYYAPIIQAENALYDAVEAPEAPDSKEPDSKQAMSEVVEAPDAPISKEPDSKQAMSDAVEAPDAPNSKESESKQAMSDAVEAPDASDSKEPESKQAMSDAVEAAVAEEEESGFCLFMKGGGCKNSFVTWVECIKEADKNGEDEFDKCSEVITLLKNCVDEHPVYYAPILQAKKAFYDAIEASKAPDSKEPDSKQAMSDAVKAPKALNSKESDSKQAMSDVAKAPDAPDSKEPESKD